VLAFATSCAFAKDTLQGCLDTAMTQPAMNNCAHRDLARAEAELNRLYRELEVRYKDDQVFIKRLRAAQSAWLKFRDAQLEMKFPPRPGEPYYYGSIFPMCSMLYLQQLTDDRVATLKEWLAGSSDGDVCSGSTKSADELKESKRSLRDARSGRH
jgi:uncharacterized protein YecT (DUF1311 family)